MRTVYTTTLLSLCAKRGSYFECALRGGDIFRKQSARSGRAPQQHSKGCAGSPRVLPGISPARSWYRADRKSRERGLKKPTIVSNRIIATLDDVGVSKGQRTALRRLHGDYGHGLGVTTSSDRMNGACIRWAARTDRSQIAHDQRQGRRKGCTRSRAWLLGFPARAPDAGVTASTSTFRDSSMRFTLTYRRYLYRSLYTDNVAANMYERLSSY
jgi:hypothetical protein